MIPVQYCPCIFKVAAFFGFGCPRQLQQPVKIVAYQGYLRHSGRHFCHAGKLLKRFFPNLTGHIRGFDSLLQLIVFLRITVAQFLLYSLDLLSEIILLLRVIHLLLDPQRNIPFKLCNLILS